MYCAESDADPGTEYDSLAWVLTQTKATHAAGSVHPSVLLLRLLVAQFLYIEQALTVSGSKSPMNFSSTAAGR